MRQHGDATARRRRRSGGAVGRDERICGLRSGDRRACWSVRGAAEGSRDRPDSRRLFAVRPSRCDRDSTRERFRARRTASRAERADRLHRRSCEQRVFGTQSARVRAKSRCRRRGGRAGEQAHEIAPFLRIGGPLSIEEEELPPAVQRWRTKSFLRPRFGAQQLRRRSHRRELTCNRRSGRVVLNADEISAFSQRPCRGRLRRACVCDQPRSRAHVRLLVCSS
jgi:hypothetical protein